MDSSKDRRGTSHARRQKVPVENLIVLDPSREGNRADSDRAHWLVKTRPANHGVKFLADRIDGFKFDHSPLKVASKWLTPSDRLENPALEPTDAQRYIIELGRSSVARHGTADATLQALTAAVKKKNTAI
jgi:hypothetical protein